MSLLIQKKIFYKRFRERNTDKKAQSRTLNERIQKCVYNVWIKTLMIRFSSLYKNTHNQYIHQLHTQREAKKKKRKKKVFYNKKRTNYLLILLISCFRTLKIKYSYCYCIQQHPSLDGAGFGDEPCC